MAYFMTGGLPHILGRATAKLIGEYKGGRVTVPAEAVEESNATTPPREPVPAKEHSKDDMLAKRIRRRRYAWLVP
jgi:hypothetical protein